MQRKVKEGFIALVRNAVKKGVFAPCCFRSGRTLFSYPVYSCALLAYSDEHTQLRLSLVGTKTAERKGTTVKQTVLSMTLMSLVAAGTYASIPQDKTPAFEEILKIDVHSHIFEEMPEFVEMMQRINLHIVNICVRGNLPERLEPMERQAEFLHRCPQVR